MTTDRVLYLIRHADALDRAGWTQPDRIRPLSERGAAQAQLIADRLAPRPIVRLLSSPYARCVATLEPLAGRLGLALEEADYLAEGHGISRVTSRLLEDALSCGPDTELAACSHGDIVPFVIAQLAAAAKLELPERSSPKAVVYTVRLEDDAVVEIQRTAPPRP